MGSYAVQASFFDLRDAGGRACLPEPYRVGPEAISVRALVDALGGTQWSGQQRVRTQAEVNAALKHVYLHAWALTESEEAAAAVLLHICARDLSPAA
jgi:hypothetical protein